MSRYKQVIATLEAERDEVLQRLTWLEKQIDEFREQDERVAPAAAAAAPDVAPPPRSRRRATATRASSRRAEARKRKPDVKGQILDHLAGNPGSTAGDIAKALDLDRTRIAGKVTHMLKLGEVVKARRGYKLPS